MCHRRTIISDWLSLLSTLPKNVLAKVKIHFYTFSYNDSFNRLKKWRSSRKVNERRDAVCQGASKNIGRPADPVVRSSQRWPDDQDDRYLLSISSFHFFSPQKLPLPPPVRRVRFVVASFMLEEFLLFTSSRRSRGPPWPLTVSWSDCQSLN